MRRFIFTLALSSVLLGGCAYIEPLVRDFNIVPLAEERELGEKLSSEMVSELKIDPGHPEARKVTTIGNRLVAALPRRDFVYQFFVVQDPTPNAFTIPGGRIYVHTGLLDFADDDNELAGVIAHEVAHAYERHPAKALSLAYGMDYMTKIMTKGQEASLKNLALQIAKGGLLLRYSRQDEDEADVMAVRILYRAGYPPDGLVRFLKKLSTLETSSKLPAVFRTHPPTPERIARIEELIRSERLEG